MQKAIMAKKLGMTQIFSENGMLIPVTVLEAGPCVVVQKKTAAVDGYNSVQVGYGVSKPKQVRKPVKGHYDAHLGAQAKPNKLLREFKFDNCDAFAVGTEIKADIFAAGDYVDVTATSKGKGFQGAIKRHGFSQGRRTHGSKYHRGSGAKSAGTTPGKVVKGRKLPGHMGNVRVTVQNLEVVRADAEKNILLVRGAVPGIRGAVVTVKSTVKQ